MQLQNLKKAKSFSKGLLFYFRCFFHVFLFRWTYRVCTFDFQKHLIYLFHFIFAPPHPRIFRRLLHIRWQCFTPESISLLGSRVSKKVYPDSADELSFYSRSRLSISAMYRVSQYTWELRDDLNWFLIFDKMTKKCTIKRIMSSELFKIWSAFFVSLKLTEISNI